MLPDGKEVIYGFLSEGTVAIADEALGDVWDIGSRDPTVKLSPITWTDDPFDRYWAFIFYGLRPLSNLLYAYYTTGNTAYRDKLLEVIRSYDAYEVQRGATMNPLLDDPHTASFRAMMLVNIYGKLSRSGDLPDDVAGGMLASIEKVSAFLALDANFQDHENHGFNEAAALLSAAVNFPQMPSAAAWQALALSRLQTLSRDTIDADGVEIENSPFYQFYVLSAVVQDAKWMSTYGVPKPDGFDARVASMFDYATYSTQPDGYVPLLGASVTLDVNKLYPKIYDADALDGLAGIEAMAPAFTFVRELGASGTAPTVLNKRYPVSGQSFLRSGFGSKSDCVDQTWISFNVGNYRSAHNHFDALGITYYANGKALLPDSGLYEYGSSSAPEPLTTYFWGTRAHNTVVVDGADQPLSAAPLVVGGAVIERDGWLYQSGGHDLYPGVSHRRSVLLLARDVSLFLDQLESASPHDYAQTWHFEPDATVVATDLDLAAADSKGNAELALHQAAVTAGTTLSLLDGQDGAVIQGFFSDEYGHKVPNYAAEYHVNATQAGFATLLASGKYASAAATVSAAYDFSRNAVSATVCADDVQVDVVVTNQAADAESVTVTPSRKCP
jgi:hypothetical protein